MFEGVIHRSAGPGIGSIAAMGTLGACSYVVMLSDLLIAPFTSSNTARSAGIIFPIVRNLPGLYGSKPNDPSSRKIGGYIMWVPVMLAVGISVPGMPIKELALLLAMTHGIMGVITPYATGPAPVYYGAGYIPSKDFWRQGLIFGVIFITALLGISGSIMLAVP